MVGLNGRALPEFEIEQDHPISVTYAKADKHNDLNQQSERPSPATSRRARSTHISRGPKPLLPRSLKEALQLAELLSKSKLIPKGFETPETCLVGILYGMEVGLSPIAALQRMAVIDGRPTIWGDAALALVQASGLLQSIKEDLIEGTAMNADSESVFANTKVFEVSTSTSTSNEYQSNLTAVCKFRREGRAEPIIGTFSIDDAKRAGLWQKPGPWTDYPKRMLIMRARAFALRDAFPDVLAGLYIREEFEGSSRRQEREPQGSPISEDADWNSVGVEQSKSSQVSRRAPPPPLPLSQQSETGTESDGGTENERSTESVRDTEREKDPITHSENKDSLDTTKSPVGISGVNQDEGDAETQLDPETLLDLFDSALCCALDLPTLEEIVDDFAGRLKPLSKDHQKRVHKIIDRQHRRVEGLDHTRQPQAEDSQTYGSLPNTKLPRGLKSLLPGLGIGRKPSTRRIDARGNRLSRSLASWNARQPLIPPNVKLEHREDVPAQDPTREVSE